MKPVPLLFKKNELWGPWASYLKVYALKDQGDYSSLFMRYIMYAFWTPKIFTTDDKNVKIIIKAFGTKCH